MAISRSESVWWQEDLQKKDEILKLLWSNLSKLDDQKLNRTIEFLASCSLDAEIFEDKHLAHMRINDLMQEAKNGNYQLEDFKKYFKWLSPLEAKTYLFNTPELGKLDTWDKPKEPLEHVDNADKAKLSQYLSAGNISAAVSVGNVRGEMLNLPDNSPPYAIHSVAKIFTCLLLLKMIQGGMLAENKLDLPIYNNDLINSDALGLLPEYLQKHLEKEKITLKQLMTHKSGLGDYGYDQGTGTLRDTMLANQKVHDLTDIKNFLRYAEVKVYNPPDYSNLGLVMVGLAIEHAYQKANTEHPLSFNKILEKYILQEAGMTCFSAIAPDNAIYNSNDPIAKNWVGSPAGGYWTTTDDLCKFGRWIYKQCEDPDFKKLVQDHGVECLRADRIEHPGSSQTSSAFFSVSLETGNVIAVLSDQPGVATALGLELLLGGRIFKTRLDNQEKLCSTAKISAVIGEPALKSMNTADDNLQQSVSTAQDKLKAHNPTQEKKSDETNQKSPSRFRTPSATPKLKPPGSYE